MGVIDKKCIAFTFFVLLYIAGHERTVLQTRSSHRYTGECH